MLNKAAVRLDSMAKPILHLSAFLIFLTAKGVNLLQLLPPLAKDSLNQALAGLNQADIEKLKHLLNSINKNLE